MPDLLILNGHVLDPSTGLDAPRDLLLRDGLVAAVETPGSFADLRAESFDARGLTVAPGLIDLHVHLREPGQTHKETIATGTRAALAGGFTTVVAMPNTVPVNDSVETLAWMLSPDRKPVTRLFAMTAATAGSMGERLNDLEALAQAGALGFTDDGKPILSEDLMRETLVRAARLGLPVSQHAEDPRLSNKAIMNAGPVAFQLGLRGYPAEAEATIVRRDLRLLADIERGGYFDEKGLCPHLHVQHISTGLALEAIRKAKRQGLHVTCEAAPHHFTLTDEAVARGGVDGSVLGGRIAFDTNAKMNPPLRSESDRQALIAALLDGTVDAIATDHAPHALFEKQVEFERAPNGITGLETALGLALRVLHRKHGAPLARIVELMSTSPARIANLTQAGTLKPGAWADLTCFDPQAEWTFSTGRSLSKSKNSPFYQTRMQGRVAAVILGGKIVFHG